MEIYAQSPAAALKEKGVKPSHQRIRILKYLQSHRIHPCAEQVFEGLREEMPTLSKSTVYSTLRTFADSGLIREIVLENHEARYDYALEDHGHFRCSVCGAIYDFGIRIGDYPPNELQGFRIDGKSVCLTGICRECMEKGTAGAKELPNHETSQR